MKKIIILIVAFFVLSSCAENNRSEEKKVEQAVQKIDSLTIAVQKSTNELEEIIIPK